MKKMKLDIQKFGASISIYAEERNVNIANNTSDLYLSVSITTTGSTYNMEGNAYFNISAVGQNNSHSVGNTYYTINRNSTVTVYQGIIGSFYHNADGTLNPIAINVYSYVTSSTQPSASATCNMSTIPRATPTINISGTIGSSVAINISPYSTSFRHAIQLVFGNITETINLNAGVTSTTYTIPTTFYSQIPNSQQGSGQVIVYTYNGNDLIGTSGGGALTLYTDENACKPDLTFSVVDTNQTTTTLTGDANVIILNRSTLEATITASSKNSANLSSLNVLVGTINQPITISGNSYSGTIPLNSSSSGELKATVIDTRNYQKEIVLTKNTINYTELFADITFFRNSPVGDKMYYKIDGNFWNGDFGAYTNAILNAKWRVKEGTSGTFSNWTNLIYSLVGTETVQKIYSGANVEYATNVEIQNPLEQSGEWNYQKSYTFEILIQDRLVEIPITKRVSKGKPIYNWYEDNDENYFNVNGDILMNNLSLLYDIIYPVGSIYISMESTNPQTYMVGTTWVQLKSRFLVGTGDIEANNDNWCGEVIANSYNFGQNSSGEMGGEVAHILTTNEMPTHRHEGMTWADNQPITLNSGSYGGYAVPYTTGTNENTKDYIYTQYAGGGQAFYKMPPYITVYMWKRVS